MTRYSCNCSCPVPFYLGDLICPLPSYSCNCICPLPCNVCIYSFLLCFSSEFRKKFKKYRINVMDEEEENEDYSIEN